MAPSLPGAPSSAVEEGSFLFGRYGGRFERANFLDARRLWRLEAPRWVKTWRLKEWRAILLGDASFSCVAALYNAKLFSIALFKAWDRVSGERRGFLRVVPGSVIPLGERLSPSRSFYHGRHARLDFDFALEENRVGLVVNWRPGRGEGGFHGEFVLGCGPKTTSPSSVVLPLGRNRAMYSTKALAGAEGFLETASGIHRFEAASSSALFEDHKGYYPFSLRYDWVGGFGFDAKGRRVGFSLTGNPTREQPRFTENSLWIGNKLFPLPPVRLSRAEGYKGEWVIQDTEGLVDLVFTPQAHNDVSFHVGLFESDWHGPFGVFKGFVKNGEGETIDASLLTGMGEEKYLRS